MAGTLSLIPESAPLTCVLGGGGQEGKEAQAASERGTKSKWTTSGPSGYMHAFFSKIGKKIEVSRVQKKSSSCVIFFCGKRVYKKIVKWCNSIFFAVMRVCTTYRKKKKIPDVTIFLLHAFTAQKKKLHKLQNTPWQVISIGAMNAA